MNVRTAGRTLNFVIGRVILDTKALLLPASDGWKAFGTGKLVDDVLPVRNRSWVESDTKPEMKSLEFPPKYVEYVTAVASGVSRMMKPSAKQQMLRIDLWNPLTVVGSRAESV